ncbi:hypothetical protein M3Y94_01157900 [Aphelenchoides besseyi]|nr:hypothetical protein M3Y94_01157900 [Aphelenchoides besseyi]KAI6228035.1 hypothetical protein M3Y95_00580000 [Aphelenchoides besseyi]
MKDEEVVAETVYRYKIENLFVPLQPTLSRGYGHFAICVLEAFSFLMFGILSVVEESDKTNMILIVNSIVVLFGSVIHCIGINWNSNALLYVHCCSSVGMIVFQLMVIYLVVFVDMYHYPILNLKETRVKVEYYFVCLSACNFVFLLGAISSWLRAREIRRFCERRHRFIFSLRCLDAYIDAAFEYPMLQKYFAA